MGVLLLLLQDGSLYAITKGVEHSAAPHRPGVVRMEDCHRCVCVCVLGRGAGLAGWHICVSGGPLCNWSVCSSWHAAAAAAAILGAVLLWCSQAHLTTAAHPPTRPAPPAATGAPAPCPAPTARAAPPARPCCCTLRTSASTSAWPGVWVWVCECRCAHVCGGTSFPVKS